MWLKYLLSGFIVKLLAGFDDSMVHVPIMSHMTRSRKGRIAFAIGIFIAVTLVIGFAFLFGSAIKKIPGARYISAGLICLLAVSVYFNIFISKPKKKIREKIQHVRRVSNVRFLKLMGIGFVTAFATIIDDTIAYSGLFLSSTSNFLYIFIGLFVGLVFQLFLVVTFTKQFQKIKYKKEITTISLIILAGLIGFGVL